MSAYNEDNRIAAGAFHEARAVVETLKRIGHRIKRDPVSDGEAIAGAIIYCTHSDTLDEIAAVFARYAERRAKHGKAD